MGIFSLPKSPKGPSRLESAGVATLGGVQVSLTLLEKLMDGTSIPFVKGAVGTALEVIKIAKGIQSDREDCDNLIKRTTSLLIVILDSLKGKSEKEIPSYLKQAIERLSTNFQEVLDEIRIIEKRVGKRSSSSIAKAILYHFDNTEKLKECSTKLEWAIAEFQVTSKVDSCLKDLERHEQLRDELRESRMVIQDGQAKIEAKIQDGQAKIQEDLAKIRDVVQDKISGDTPLSLPSTFMPASPKIFGRHSYIEKVVRLLLSGTSTRVAILGPGGMGKTSVALKAIHDARIIERFGFNRRWVPCEQATSVPLFSELIAKSLGLPPSTSNDRFSEIIAALEESGVLQIVLFDNFETIWDIEGERSAIANILSRLASIPTVSLILTMRGIQHPASNLIDWTSPRLPPLTPLEMDPAQEAFVQISPDSEGDPNLPELLHELDCMPLAITLMAKLAEVGETIAELLSQWRQEQVKLLSQPGGDRTSSIEVSIRLSLISSPVRTNGDAIPLLSVLAKLPGGASLTLLPSICPSIPGWKGALRVLRTAALVYDSPDKTVVYMLSPIRSYVSLYHPLADGPLQALRHAYYELADEAENNCRGSILVEALPELSREEINLESIIVDALQHADNKENAIAAASAYSYYLNFTQPRINVIEAAIQVARHSRSDLLPFCLHNYADSLRYQSQYDAASFALDEAIDGYIKANNKINAAHCLWIMGDILRLQNKCDKACSKLEEGISYYRELGDVGGTADCLMILGQVHGAQGNFEVARSTLEEAKSMFLQVQSGIGIANCLQSLGKMYRAQGGYEVATSAAEEAKAMYIKLHSPLGIANSLKVLSDIHYDQGQYVEAYSAAEEARVQYIKWGEKLGTADSLLSMGHSLFRQGRYDEARRAAEEVENEYRRLGISQGINDSRRLLGDIHRMQGEYDTARSLLEQAKLSFSQQEPSIYTSLGLASCNSSLGKISRLQGQYDHAIELLEKARTTYSTLGSTKHEAAECAEEIALALKARNSGEKLD
ncbi:hypothetical protein FRC03_008513 [Tulasnella sp. 419]|nr:hypothetical protein FRC03_008513 [Tulasnella sp. 419]